MKDSTNPTIRSVEDIVATFAKAVKQFGTYTAQDKGVSEIYDVENVLTFLREDDPDHDAKWNGERAGKDIARLCDHPSLKDEGMGELLAEHLIQHLADSEVADDWWEACVAADARFPNMY